MPTSPLFCGQITEERWIVAPPPNFLLCFVSGSMSLEQGLQLPRQDSVKVASQRWRESSQDEKNVGSRVEVN